MQSAHETLNRNALRNDDLQNKVKVISNRSKNIQEHLRSSQSHSESIMRPMAQGSSMQRQMVKMEKHKTIEPLGDPKESGKSGSESERRRFLIGSVCKIMWFWVPKMDRRHFYGYF